jgi:hypothetical protein
MKTLAVSTLDKPMKNFALEKLRLVTPILVALCFFMLTNIWTNLGALADKMESVKERVAALEATIKILSK